MDNNNISGVVHVHSNYSYDGKLTIKELKNLCKGKGYSFIVLTEHADDFDKKKMQLFVSECRNLSDNEFIIIPGLEFNCEGMHILAIGIEEFIPESNLEELIKKMHEQGGLAVLAHVIFYDEIPYKRLYDLDGVEVWNTRYDRKFAPSVKSMSILRRFRKQKKDIMAFCGLDLHDKHVLGEMITVMRVNKLSKESIVDTLRAGRFHGSNGLISFSSRTDPSLVKLFIFSLIRFHYVVTRSLLIFFSLIYKKIRGYKVK